MAAAAVLLQACSMLGQMDVRGPAIVQLEVWNRTLDDVFLLDPSGRLINVPACGHAAPAALDVSLVELRTDGGRISTFANSGSPSPQYLIVVFAQGESFPTNQRPVALPPCFGHPIVVP
jgi:hypothetical protein